MTEGQRRLLIAGGVAALLWWLYRQPAAQRDLSALYRSLTQGLGAASSAPDAAFGAGEGQLGPLESFFSSLADMLRGRSVAGASGGSQVFRPLSTVQPAGAPAPFNAQGLVNNLATAVQNAYKLYQNAPDIVSYVKNLYTGLSNGVATFLAPSAGSVSGDVLGTGALTNTAPDILLPVGQGGADVVPVADFVGGGTTAFDPATVGAPAGLQGSGYVAGGVGDAVPVADIGAGAVDAGGAGVDLGAAGVVAGTEGSQAVDAVVFASEGVATASEIAAPVTAGIGFVVALGLQIWQSAEEENRHYYTTFPSQIRATTGSISYALGGLGGDTFSRRLGRVTTKQELADEVGGFKTAIQLAGVGSYAAQGSVFQLAPLPGAGGSAHEGGVVADYSLAQQGVQNYIDHLAATLPGPDPIAPDTGSQKYRAAVATYTNPTGGYGSVLSTPYASTIANQGGGQIVVGTVPGTDQIRTVDIPASPGYSVPQPVDPAILYGPPALIAP